jgi:hypothetical protein
MKYIDFKPALKTGSRTVVRRRYALALRTGESQIVTFGAMDAFMAEIDCRYQLPVIRPLHVEPEAVPATRGPADQQDAVQYLVQVGFALALPENCHLRWARFVVNQHETAESIVDPVKFVSLLPTAVDEEIDMSDRSNAMMPEISGEVSRRPVLPDRKEAITSRGRSDICRIPRRLAGIFTRRAEVRQRERSTSCCQSSPSMPIRPRSSANAFIYIWKARASARCRSNVTVMQVFSGRKSGSSAER